MKKSFVRSSRVTTSSEEENEEDVYTSGSSDEEDKKTVKRLEQPKNEDESDALVDSSDEEDRSIKTQKQIVAGAKPITTESASSRMMIRKHKCLQAMVAMPKTLLGADACSPDKPAMLQLDKVKFHYMIHYIHRGYWNSIVPELSEEEKSNVAAYQCNICKKQFRNNLSKKEYSGRGSFLCHLAIEHGKIVEAMQSDREADMTTVLELLCQSDRAVKDFVDKGTKTPHDSDLVTVKRDVFYNYTVTAASAPSNTNRVGPPSAAEDARYLSCPKCSDLRKNSDAAALKIHLLQQHYKDRWDKKLASTPRDSDTLYYCDLCPSRKRFESPTAHGVRGAITCHWAIQHDQLKDVLRHDPDITDKFIARLYKEVKVGEESIDVGSRLMVVNKNSSLDVKKRAPQKKTLAKKAKRVAEEEELTDESTTSEDDDVVGEMFVKKHKNTSKPAQGPVSGSMNTNYIRKRSKIDFTLDNFDDSDEWSEEEYGVKGSKKKSKILEPVDSLKSRQLPKRASAMKRKSLAEIESDDEF